jgi:hypothetical protein
MDNYSQLLERICRSSNLQKEEVERKIEAKRAKLSGLVSKEGAAQIVAAELGINFDQERMKLSEIVQGMKRANVVGKIIQTFPIREFNKNGKQGKVANLRIADETSNARLVLWDTNHIELLEKNKIKEGDVIEISNGNIRNGEIHLSSFSDIKQSKETLSDVITEKLYPTKNLSEIKPGENIKTRATIVQTFEPRFFEVNPESGKKFTEADKNNGLKPKKRALLNIVLDDGHETIRSVLFAEKINLLGLTDEEIFSLEKFNEKKDKILGEEMLFSGQIRNNQIFNTTEMTIESIDSINPDELIKELENTNN